MKNPLPAPLAPLIAASALFPSSGFRPAKPNQYVTVYANAFGDANPAVTPGEFVAGAASVTGSVRVLLNGRTLPTENILHAAITPFSPGLCQLNILLPADTPDGDLSLVIEIGGVASPPGAYLTVRAAE
jgi:uncharacterized protein (TIGR03437 family)